MKTIASTVASLLLCATAVPALAQEKPAQRAFRWVDDKGVVHYGDSVPAEFSRQQTSQLNPQGVEVHQSPAQLSPNDAHSAEEKAAAVARQKQHDSFLLATYTSARDIEQLRDERVGLVEAQIVAANGFLASAESRMKALLDRAKNFKPYSDNPTARRMPDTAGRRNRPHGERRAVPARDGREEEDGEGPASRDVPVGHRPLSRAAREP